VSARLDCPLCGAVVAEAVADIAPGMCPGCGARYEGGEGSAPDAVRTALLGFGADALDPAAVTDAVFRLTPADSAGKGVAITSDERDDFYRWWLFVRPGDGGDPVAVISGI
jgi:hypothetical protein